MNFTKEIISPQSSRRKALSSQRKAISIQRKIETKCFIPFNIKDSDLSCFRKQLLKLRFSAFVVFMHSWQTSFYMKD
jgi:hypothetical protein